MTEAFLWTGQYEECKRVVEDENGNPQSMKLHEETLDGTFFQPNIPSEEIFTSPRKGEAEGIVYSAKPLVYQGQLIRDFYVKFKDGKEI